MVVVYTDILFAKIPGIDHGEYHLDLYLPNTLPTKDYTFAKDKRYDGIKEVKNVTNNISGCIGLHEPKQTGGIANVGDYVKEGGDMLAFGDEVTGDVNTKESYSENNSRVPFVLFIHGGGWRRGGRTDWKYYCYSDVNFLAAFVLYFIDAYNNIGETMAQNNIACAKISYPLIEAGPLLILIDMIVSYLKSSVFVFLSCLLVLLIVTLIKTMTQCRPMFNTWELLFSKDTISTSIAKTMVVIAMLVTNLMTSLLIFIRRTQFSINHIRMFSAMITVCCVVSYQSNAPVFVLVITTLAVNQLMLFNSKVRRSGISYKHQLKAVAQAVRWAKQFSEETGYTDATRLYLMGHSAGGHLATLFTLDESAMASSSCSSADLKVV